MYALQHLAKALWIRRIFRKLFMIWGESCCCFLCRGRVQDPERKESDLWGSRGVFVAGANMIFMAAMNFKNTVVRKPLAASSLMRFRADLGRFSLPLAGVGTPAALPTFPYMRQFPPN